MKETVSKVKRQPSEWQEIIANEATDKESQKYTSCKSERKTPIQYIKAYIWNLERC